MANKLVTRGDRSAIEYVITTDLTAGEKGHIEIPFDCYIEQGSLLADQTGSAKVDIWVDTYANFPPTNADSICGGNELEISAAEKDQDATLTGWTRELTRGSIMAFNLDSVDTIQRLTVSLEVTKR